MSRFDVKELLSGSILIVLGLFFATVGSGYGIGPISNMQPGNFPQLLGAIATVIGVILLIPGLRKSGTMPTIAWGPLVGISCSIALFAATIDRFGLIPAAFVSAFACLFALPRIGMMMRIALSASIAVMMWIIFVVGLDLPMQALKGWA